jgi:hypothetical protein
MILTIALGVMIYAVGCGAALMFFLVGRSPSLLERNWHWPVIFLWPLLPLWPFRSLPGKFRRLKFQRPEIITKPQVAPVNR